MSVFIKFCCTTKHRTNIEQCIFLGRILWYVKNKTPITPGNELLSTKIFLLDYE